MKSKTLLAVVVFPSIVPYISDYVVSIKKQTYQNFDWLVINDGASEAVKELFPENIIWQSAEKNETPYTIRNKIMDFAFENNYLKTRLKYSIILILCTMRWILLPKTIR